MHWFALTDGLLWIQAGESTIYEYSQAAKDHWNCDETYNDYQLSRFLEDFSGIFHFVREPVPELLYDHIADFVEWTHQWKMQYMDEPDERFDAFYDDEYTMLTAWFFLRCFDSGHLTGGPLIGCFRCGDKIKLYWESDYLLDDGNSIWTAPKGAYEMPYTDFVAEVERCFDTFFTAMDTQVRQAAAKDWGDIHLDTQKMMLEHQIRKDGFRQNIAMLHGTPDAAPDWNKILSLFDQMRNELR